MNASIECGVFSRMPIPLSLLLLWLPAGRAWAVRPDETSLWYYRSTEQVRADVEAAYRGSPKGEISRRTAGRYLVLGAVLEASWVSRRRQLGSPKRRMTFTRRVVVFLLSGWMLFVPSERHALCAPA